MAPQAPPEAHFTAMTTLRFPVPEDMTPEDREIVEGVARRLGKEPGQLSAIWRAQMHWPHYLEANLDQTMRGFRYRGVIPELTKEAMHAGVSMVNRCEF